VPWPASPARPPTCPPTSPCRRCWSRRTAARCRARRPASLGQRYAPFWVTGDTTGADFSLDTLELPAELGAERFRDRVDLQAALDRHAEGLSGLPEGRDLDGQYDRAYRLLRSGACRRAFRLADEPDRVRQRYGLAPLRPGAACWPGGWSRRASGW